MLEQIQAAAQWISTHTTLRPTVAIVLGTGLGRLAEENRSRREVFLR